MIIQVLVLTYYFCISEVLFCNDDYSVKLKEKALSCRVLLIFWHFFRARQASRSWSRTRSSCIVLRLSLESSLSSFQISNRSVQSICCGKKSGKKSSFPLAPESGSVKTYNGSETLVSSYILLYCTGGHRSAVGEGV